MHLFMYRPHVRWGAPSMLKIIENYFGLGCCTAIVRPQERWVANETYAMMGENARYILFVSSKLNRRKRVQCPIKNNARRSAVE